MYHIVEFWDGIYCDLEEAYNNKEEAEAKADRITEEDQAFSRFDYAAALDDNEYKYFLENGVCP